MDPRPTQASRLHVAAIILGAIDPMGDLLRLMPPHKKAARTSPPDPAAEASGHDAHLPQAYRGTERKSPLEKPLGRNTPCRCGSGKKFKRCCLIRK